MDHMHEHEHTHEEGHVHSHEHHHATNLQETKVLLSFMIQHNDHHIEELADLLDSMPPKARKKLSLAIGTFEAANVELREVLDCL